MPSVSIQTLAAALMGALAASLVLGAMVLFLRDDGNAPVQVALSTPGPEDVSLSNTGAAEAELKVYISGAVRNPGV